MSRLPEYYDKQEINRAELRINDDLRKNPNVGIKFSILDFKTETILSFE